MSKYSSIVSQLQQLKVRIDELKTEQQQVQQKLVACPKHFNDVATNSNPVRKALEAMNGSQLLKLVTVELKNVGMRERTGIDYRKHLQQRILPKYPASIDGSWTRDRVFTIIQNAIIEDGGRSVLTDEFLQWMTAFDQARGPYWGDLGHLV